MDILKKLVDLENKASNYGFKWETTQQIVDQIQSEIAEIKVHLVDGQQIKLKEEIGDLLHAVFSLCVFCQFNPEETLTNSVNKFASRFGMLQSIAESEGLKSVNGLSFDELMRLWNEAKKQTTLSS